MAEPGLMGIRSDNMAAVGRQECSGPAPRGNEASLWTACPLRALSPPPPSGDMEREHLI